MDMDSASPLVPFAHDSIPYSATFINALMSHILQSTPTTRADHGIRVLPTSQPNPENPLPSTSGRQSQRARNTIPLPSIDETALPKLALQDLPVALDDPRRVYKSAIPGVLLTHPGGFIEGGTSTADLSPTPASAITVPRANIAGNSPTIDPFTIPDAPATTASDSAPTSSAYTAYLNTFLTAHPSVRTPLELQRAIAAETATQLEALNGQMREREDAVKKNDGIEREIRKLEADRELERKVVEGLKRRGTGTGAGTGTGGEG